MVRLATEQRLNLENSSNIQKYDMKKKFSPSPIVQRDGLAVIRIIVGVFMIYHGSEVFDASKIQVYATWDIFKKFSSVFYHLSGEKCGINWWHIACHGVFYTNRISYLNTNHVIYIFFCGKWKDMVRRSVPLPVCIAGPGFLFYRPLQLEC